MKHLNLRDAKVAIIGLGGMGIRHIRACQLLGANVVAICDKREEALVAGRREAPKARAYTSAGDFISSIADCVDLVCVVTNTPSRAKIMLDLVQAGTRRVLTEKPFTTNLTDAYSVTQAYEKVGVQLTVNTFRHFCDNHIRLRQLIRSGRLGEPRYIAIQCASTGLGNMGSVFFDVMNFYLESRPIEVTGVIDKTGTPNVRGPQFRDPGGFGMVCYENGVRGFIDTSEDTGVPYTFHIVTTYGRILIDELFNEWRISVRSEKDTVAYPLTYYLAPLIEVPFELTHRYDPMEMTSFTIRAALEDSPTVANAAQAITAMEMIIAMHVSDQMGRVPISLPLDRKYHKIDIPFA